MRVITIGRSSDNDVVISDTSISRYHLRITEDDSGNFSLDDLNSANGTYVNGKMIHETISLNQGDVVRIGNTTLPWQSYFPQNDQLLDSSTQVLDNQCGYAKIHFYRGKNIIGFAITPKLYINGHPVSKIKWNWKKTITIYIPGVYNFSATTEVTKKFQLHVEMNREYYVRCSMGWGLAVGRIKFTLMNAERAQQDIRNLKQEIK
jgi:hypothetical protein